MSEHLVSLDFTNGRRLDFYREEKGASVCDNDNICATLPDATAQQVIDLLAILEPLAQEQGGGLMPDTETSPAGPVSQLPTDQEFGACFVPADDVAEEDKLYCAATLLVEEAAAKEEGTPPACQHGVTMLVQEGCPYCQEAQENYKDIIDMGYLQVVDLYSDRGQKLAEAVPGDTIGTPTFLLVDCTDRVLEILQR